MLLALIATAASTEMRFCSQESRRQGPPASVVPVEDGGWAVVVSPDGYALVHRAVVDGRSELVLGDPGARRRADVIATSDDSGLALVAFEPFKRWGCSPVSPKVYDHWGLWGLEPDGDWTEGQAGEEWGVLSFKGELAHHTPIFNGDTLVGFWHVDEGQKLESDDMYQLGIRWRYASIQEPKEKPSNLPFYGLVGLVSLVSVGWFMVWGLPKTKDKARGARSEAPRPCPYAWVGLAEGLGLEVEGPGLSGEIEQFPVRITYDGEQTVVHVRCPVPHGMQATHVERAANVRDRLELDNPVASGLIAVGGEPELVELLHDEAVLGPLLEVVHGRPGSTIDGEGVTLRAPGKWEEQLPTLIEQALAAARALQA